ncbi:MAG: alpha/beta fold hydrolase, partial [Chitinophagales bacterium]
MLQLNYKKFGSGNQHLIILHGFLGSLDNFQTIAKALEEQFTIYLIDARNHGKSPHTNSMSYELMANDIIDFCQQHQITKTSIIGHSMGGKTAAYLALIQPALIHQLFMVDIAP